MTEYFLTGTYSEPILFGTGELFEGKGEGIYLCALEDGDIRILDCLKLGNPSFLAINEEKKHIYAVNEMKEFKGVYGGGLTDIVYDDTGQMTVVDSFPTGGGDPCHVAVSPDGGVVCVANYADGKVTAFPLSQDGTVLPEKQVFAHSGHSIHPTRQEGPHAHNILYSQDGRLFVTDLGIDSLKAYKVTQNGIEADEDRTVVLSPGSGPRTGEWSEDGKHFYVSNELAASVTHMYYDGDSMQIRETVTTLPEGDQTENSCADLHLSPNGEYLFASNRGHDTIVTFKVAQDGSLSASSWESCRGKTPRNFAIDPSGKYLLVGNQDSDCIVVFEIMEDGQLHYIVSKDFPTPVCIRFFQNGLLR